jgi:hypothetical protein
VPAPRDPVPILNGSGEDIPSHAVVEPTGVVVDGAMTVRKPTVDGFRGVWVNTEGVIPTGQSGQATRLPGVTVLVDGSPAVGDEWGAQAGSWKLGDVGGGGFVINSAAVAGRVNAVRYGVRVVETVSGSGSGTDVNGDGVADRRAVFDQEQYRCENGQLAVYTRPVYQYLGSGLMSAGTTWTFDRYEGCCSCGDSGSGSGSGSGGGGTFPTCVGAPAALDWTSTSGDIGCLNGLSGTINQSGSTWSNGNNVTPPCSSDNGFSVTCTGDVWTASLDTNSGITMTLISQTSTSLTFQAVSTGAGTIPAGTATFVVVIP